MGYERNFGNVTYNVLFNPPEYLVASIDAGVDVADDADLRRQRRPVRRRRRRDQDDPGGSLRHIDQNIETAYAHFYGLSLQQRDRLRPRPASVEYTGSSGRKLYDLADPNKRGARAGLHRAPAARPRGPNPRYARVQHPRQPRPVAVPRRHVRRSTRVSSATPACSSSAKYTLGHAHDNLSTTFSDDGNNNFNLGYLDAFDPMLDWGYAQFDVRHRLALSGVWVLPFVRGASGVAKALFSPTGS